MRHVWIFQLASAPTESQKASILPQLEAFVAIWKAHGAPVPGEVSLRHERFVVVQAEPGHASGCSIDSMNKGVHEILTAAGIEILGPERVFFREIDGSIASIVTSCRKFDRFGDWHWFTFLFRGGEIRRGLRG